MFNAYKTLKINIPVSEVKIQVNDSFRYWNLNKLTFQFKFAR